MLGGPIDSNRGDPKACARSFPRPARFPPEHAWPLSSPSRIGRRKELSSALKLSSGATGKVRPARRAKARTCEGRDGFSQYAGVNAIGSTSGSECGVEQMSSGLIP